MLREGDLLRVQPGEKVSLDGVTFKARSNIGGLEIAALFTR